MEHINRALQLVVYCCISRRGKNLSEQPAFPPDHQQGRRFLPSQRTFLVLSETIWYSLAPWTLFYVVVLLIGIRKHLYNNDIKQLFLTILLTGFVVLTFSSAKLDIYLLPLFPFMAYLAFLLLPEIALPKIYFTIVLPAAVLVFVFRLYSSSQPFSPCLG